MANRTTQSKKNKTASRKRNKKRISSKIFLILLLISCIAFSLWYLDTEYNHSRHTTRDEFPYKPRKSQRSAKPYNSKPGKPLPRQSSSGNHPKINLDARMLMIPACCPDQPRQIIHHTGFSLSYNENWRLPNWVAYELTRKKTSGNAKRTDRFVRDPHVTGFSASHSDYTGSKFDRGHMAPAADMKWNETAMKESFYLSNICPQHPQLNRRKWKDLEEKVRDWAVSDSAIIIVCGPLVNGKCKSIGSGKVTVPQGYYKIILSPFRENPQGIGFIFSNQQESKPLKNYVVSIDSIEKLTGIDFFHSLPDDIEDTIEASVDVSYWGI